MLHSIGFLSAVYVRPKYCAGFHEQHDDIYGNVHTVDLSLVFKKKLLSCVWKLPLLQAAHIEEV